MSDDFEIEFVDELPTIDRKRDTGVWAKRLEPLRDNEMRWAKVYGPTKNPHAVIGNLSNGTVSGVDDLDWFEFKGRTQETGEVEQVNVKDEDGNETGEVEERPVREGYVFARYMSSERKAERDQELAEKRAAREAREAEKANA